MSSSRSVLYVICLGMWCSVAWASPPVQQQSVLYRSVEAVEFDYRTYVDANQLLMYTTNVGSFAHQKALPFNKAGLYFPTDSNLTMMHAGGLWLGAYVDNELRVSVAEYTPTYTPGPMKDGTYQPDEPGFKVYKIFRGLYENGFYDDPRPITDPVAQEHWDDYHHWPSGTGAPTYPDGLPRYYGDQTLWCVFNDADPAQHTNGAGTEEGLGVEVQQTSFALDIAGPLNRCIFAKYVLINQGGNYLENMFAAFWIDPDVGEATDDWVGCDKLLNLGYAYNANTLDADYGVPPAIGTSLLSGPIVPATSDSAFFLGQWRHGYRNLPLTAFIKNESETDPGNAQETYWYMQGLDAKHNGTVIIDSSTYTPTTYMYSGNPVSGSGWIDTRADVERQSWVDIRQVRGVEGSIVDPPRDVFEQFEIDGMWNISSDILGDKTRFDYLDHIGNTIWEMRFGEVGSVYNDWETHYGVVDQWAPFEVWNMGPKLADSSDDRRIRLLVSDKDVSYSWSPGDVIYFWDQPYVESPPFMPSLAETDLHIGRIVLNGDEPEYGTVIRFTATETNDTLPGSDCRYILSSGPFDMAPGDTQEVAVAVVVGAGLDQLKSVTDLKDAADTARAAWYAGFAGPRFVHPPTPPCDTIFAITAGQPLSFMVLAIDSTVGDLITLQVDGLPLGATLSPSLPHAANPVVTTFSWTPDLTQLGGHVITFIAIDESTEFTEVCTFEILVTAPVVAPRFRHPPTPPCDTTFAVRASDTLEFSVEAFDEISRDQVTLLIDELPLGAVLTPGIPLTGNPVTTSFSWVPGYAQLGPYKITFAALDSIDGLSATCGFNIHVTSPGIPPEFAHPPTPACDTTFIVTVGGSMNLSVEAFDQVAADRVTLSAVGIPDGAVLSNSLPATGNPIATSLDWQPDYSQLGRHTVAFTASDSIDGMFAHCSFVIDVVSESLPPSFTHPPTPQCAARITVTAGDSLCFTVEAFDEVTVDRVALSATGIPSSSVVSPPLPARGNPVNATVCWRPSYSDLGEFPLSFTVTDSIDNLSTQCAFVVEVVPAAIAPQFQHPPTPACDTVFAVEVGDTLRFSVRAFDEINAETLTLTAEDLPAGALLDPPLPVAGNPVGAAFLWVPTVNDLGLHSMVFVVTDLLNGLTDQCRIEVDVSQEVLLIEAIVPTDTLMIDHQFQVTLNYPIDLTTIGAGAYPTTDDGDVISGMYVMTDGNRTMVFQPAGFYPPLQEIHVDLSDIVGVGGQQWPEDSLPVVVTFHTGYGVFPGDLNNDGVVDSLDVLSIAVYWRQTGPVRVDADVVDAWNIQAAHGWVNAGAVYADADGNGIVDETDLFPIGRHWHRVHEYANPPVAVGAGINPEDYREELQAFYEAIRGNDTPFMQKVRRQLEHLLGIAGVPYAFHLAQNHPNPFNAATSIMFTLPQAERITLTVIDALGRPVCTLARGEFSAGVHTVSWNGCDDRGLHVSSGVYFYTLTGEARNMTRKMMLLK